MRFALAGLLSLMVPAAFAAAGSAAEQQTLAVRLSNGVVPMVVVNPQADRSAAWPADESAPAEPLDTAPPTPNYVLTSQVVLRLPADSTPADLALPAAVRGAQPLADLAGYWVLNTASVSDAAAVATALADLATVREAYVDVQRPIALRDPDDPQFYQQWHLKNTVEPLFDVDADGAWNLGYTGAGVTIGVVEGGWQNDHPDLIGNYNAAASMTGGSVTSHATSVAGVAAAVANNGIGVVGAAYGAQISDLIYGTDSENAAAFLYLNDVNAIKTNSWGPPDTGVIATMSSTEYAALEQAVATGRGGLGTIFVWAAGNGGTGDRIEYDPYASSRYTCAIGAIGDADTRAWYNEVGSSMLAVTESSGNSRSIYTTNSGSGYTSSFGGTSSASPLAAGVIALLLEANPALSWRDVQHVIIDSARICDPNNTAWVTNGAGHLMNENYGFGAIDAQAAVTLAAQWEPVPAEHEWSSGVIAVSESLPDGDENGVTRTVEVDADLQVESAELIVSVTTQQVGDVEIRLTSPDGTESLLAKRRNDVTDNYVAYRFTTLRNWDEAARGTWTVRLSDVYAAYPSVWDSFELRLYGGPQVGDVNCDGTIDFFDIDPFVVALTSPAAYESSYPDCSHALADTNGDGNVDFFDIDPFVVLLTQ